MVGEPVVGLNIYITVFFNLFKVKIKNKIDNALSGYLDIKYCLVLMANICSELIECWEVQNK